MALLNNQVRKNSSTMSAINVILKNVRAKVFVAFSHSRKMSGLYLKLGHNDFFPYPLHFIIY
jgi:hypothetical protein